MASLSKLSPVQLAELARKAGALAAAQTDAREHLIPFVKLMMPSPEDPEDFEASLYRPARHHLAIANALERLEQGEYRHLILCVPPRHGKTELATKKFVPWVLGRNPRWNVAVASYSDDMAEDFGAAIRECLQSDIYARVFPKTRIEPGNARKDRIKIEKGGLVVAVGRGGALTGRGANLAVVDDPFKDFEEARSQAVRDIAWNWFTKVLMTRRMGMKLVLIIMTRWHDDDIIGRLTDSQNPHYSATVARSFKIINLPALAGDDDPLGRKPGEALWPEEFDADYLTQMKALDSTGFSAMYNQDPTTEEGDLFKREDIHVYQPDELPQNLRIYAASDHAVGTLQRHDSTVMLIVGIDQRGHIWALDCFWRKSRTDVQVEAMIDLAKRWSPLIWWAPTDHIAKSIGPFLWKQMDETKTFFTVREMAPIGDKIQGAQAFAALVARGYFHLPKDAPWTERAIAQLLKFGPLSARDDFVDAGALLGRGLKMQVNASAPAEARKVPKYGTFGWVKSLMAEQARERTLADAAKGY